MATHGRGPADRTTARRLPEHRFLFAAIAAVLLVAALAFWPGRGSGGPTGSADAVAAVSPDTSPAPRRGVSEVAAPLTTAVPAPPPEAAPGTFAVAPGLSWPAGTGPQRTYTVEVETVTGVDPAEFAAVVDETLTDPRSWIGDGSVSVQRVDTNGSARILLATPATTDALCAPLPTNSRFSCGQGNTAIINLDRWQAGVDVWTGPLDEYRHYVINHEFGHVLGHGHVMCPGAGQPAPVMMQQTKGLESCLPNGWPFP